MQSSQKYSTDGSGSKRSPETIFLPPVVNVLPQTLHCFPAAFSSGVIRAVKENAVVLPLFTGIFSCSQTLDAIRYAASGAAPRSISQERSVRWRFCVSIHVSSSSPDPSTSSSISSGESRYPQRGHLFPMSSSFAISSKQPGQMICLNLLLVSEGDVGFSSFLFGESPLLPSVMYVLCLHCIVHVDIR